MLRSQGCPLVQGHLLGWPMPGDQALALLRGIHDAQAEPAEVIS
jgi:EAL domain-containing protein (putative c-di-GMP-specific phosphodiesterase class I)